MYKDYNNNQNTYNNKDQSSRYVKKSYNDKYENKGHYSNNNQYENKYQNKNQNYHKQNNDQADFINTNYYFDKHNQGQGNNYDKNYDEDNLNKPIFVGKISLNDRKPDQSLKNSKEDNRHTSISANDVSKTYIQYIL